MVTDNAEAADRAAVLTTGEDGRLSGSIPESRDRAGVMLAEKLADQLKSGLLRLDPLDGRLNGFGGLHGGVVAAACIEASRGGSAEEAWSPVAVNVNFIRAIKTTADVHAKNVHRGRRSGLSAVSIDAAETGAVLTTATVRWGSTVGTAPIVGQPVPADIVSVEDCDEFVVPREFVPIAPLFRIYPAAGALPYSGASDPRLCAWVKMSRSPLRSGSLTAAEIAVVADSLAPSIAATFTDLLTAPTVTMAINYFAHGEDAPEDSHTADPGLVLIDARSTLLGGGWVSEAIDVWNADLRPLARVMQVRLITT